MKDKDTSLRDGKTLGCLSEARDAVEQAQKSMPNHIESIFDGDDAVRLNEVHRQLSILLMAEADR